MKLEQLKNYLNALPNAYDGIDVVIPFTVIDEEGDIIETSHTIKAMEIEKSRYRDKNGNDIVGVVIKLMVNENK